MDEQEYRENRPVNPRRRKRSQLQIFKEAYLPVLIAGAAVLLIIIFIIGSISRGIQQRQLEKDASLAESVSIENEFNRLAEEANLLIADAELLAAKYDYEGAIALLDTFQGDMSQFPALAEKRASYEDAKGKLQAWDDPGQVLNLSFQLLIADTQRAFSDENYGTAYNRNFVTTVEFSKMLEELYENGYMLVSLSDFITTETTETGATIYQAKTLYLPAGKKPLILTQTNVNYNTYMIDGDGDKLPDKDGAGFASRLVIGADGKLTCEMVDSEGNTVTGAYDMVPILEDFVAKHPDFSYQGARAILAVTGYDGLFGYRTNAEARERLGAQAYDQEIEGAKDIANALRAAGYELACYTYENIPYGERTETEIKADLSGWTAEVLPILGNVDILAYAQLSDLSGSGTYGSEKHQILQDAGFRFYLGFCEDGTTWATISDNYIRQGRILVTGSNMAHHADWFEGIFDAASILDDSRGDVPN